MCDEAHIAVSGQRPQITRSQAPLKPNRLKQAAVCCTEGRMLHVSRHTGLTQPVCDEGMPPEPMRRVKSHLLSLYQYVKSFSVCAITNASTAATHGLRTDSRYSGLPLTLYQHLKSLSFRSITNASMAATHGLQTDACCSDVPSPLAVHVAQPLASL